MPILFIYLHEIAIILKTILTDNFRTDSHVGFPTTQPPHHSNTSELSLYLAFTYVLISNSHRQDEHQVSGRCIIQISEHPEFNIDQITQLVSTIHS